MAASALVLTVLFLGGAFLVAVPAYVFGGRADHAAIALLVYAMATIGLIEMAPLSGGAPALAANTQMTTPASDIVAFEPRLGAQ